MKTIGRVDLSHSLKQYFELAGQFPLTLGEGIVPAAVVADLNLTPFSLDLPFTGRVTVGAVAAEYCYAIIRGSGLPVNSWATIDLIGTLIAAGISVVIEPYAAAPALTAGGTARVMRRARIDSGQPGLPEVDWLHGTSVTAPTDIGWQLTEAATSTRYTEGPWHLTNGGILVIAAQTFNTALTVSVRGRIHFTSAK